MAALKISIHPPLAGRDLGACFRCLRRPNFNPPAPCGAGPIAALMASSSTVFQSTRPLRGGTPPKWRHYALHAFQSTRPLRGGTQGVALNALVEVFQSTRPLRGGTARGTVFPYAGEFQSTRPLRGGTAILHKKTVQNIAYCTKSAFTLAVLSGFLALMRPFFLPNVHKFRCEPSEESLLAPRSHAYTIRTPSC